MESFGVRGVTLTGFDGTIEVEGAQWLGQKFLSKLSQAVSEVEQWSLTPQLNFDVLDRVKSCCATRSAKGSRQLRSRTRTSPPCALSATRKDLKREAASYSQ